MKEITLQNYRKDRYYPRIVEAVREILTEQDEVAPVDVFVRMGLLEEKKVRAWHLGRVSYLERVINCNLAKAGRILRILRMHGHDLQLGPAVRQYRRRTAGPHTTLRFTKTRNRRLEEDYSRHYAIIGDPRKFRIKHRLAPFVPTGDHG